MGLTSWVLRASVVLQQVVVSATLVVGVALRIKYFVGPRLFINQSIIIIII